MNSNSNLKLLNIYLLDMRCIIRDHQCMKGRHHCKLHKYPLPKAQSSSRWENSKNLPQIRWAHSRIQHIFHHAGIKGNFVGKANIQFSLQGKNLGNLWYNLRYGWDNYPRTLHNLQKSHIISNLKGRQHRRFESWGKIGRSLQDKKISISHQLKWEKGLNICIQCRWIPQSQN